MGLQVGRHVLIVFCLASYVSYFLKDLLMVPRIARHDPSISLYRSLLLTQKREKVAPQYLPRNTFWKCSMWKCQLRPQIIYFFNKTLCYKHYSSHKDIEVQFLHRHSLPISPLLPPLQPTPPMQITNQ